MEVTLKYSKGSKESINPQVLGLHLYMWRKPCRLSNKKSSILAEFKTPVLERPS